MVPSDFFGSSCEMGVFLPYSRQMFAHRGSSDCWDFSVGL